VFGLVAGVLAFASAFPQPSLVGAKFVCLQSIVGEGVRKGVRGQSRTIHSLGNTATLASPGHLSNAGAAFLFGDEGIATVPDKLVVLFVLLAICVALSKAQLWMERRSRAAAVIQLVRRARCPSV
jgi:hypothetical protein